LAIFGHFGPKILGTEKVAKMALFMLAIVDLFDRFFENFIKNVIFWRFLAIFCDFRENRPKSAIFSLTKSLSDVRKSALFGVFGLFEIL